MSESKDPIQSYREHLVLSEQKSQEDYDKTVLSLSAGALGVSFAFIKDVIGPNNVVTFPLLIIFAWVCWGFSVFVVLISYYSSHLALRRAISQVDKGTIYKEHAGGIIDFVTEILNIAGAVLFFIGVIFAALFVLINWL